MRAFWILLFLGLAIAALALVAQRYRASEEPIPHKIETETKLVVSSVPQLDRIRREARPASDADWFRDRTKDSGIDFQHASGDSPEKPFPAANGSGIAAVDFDRDGWLDLYFATGTSIPITSSSSHSNRLYRNRGRWQFADVTNHTGVGHQGYSCGIAVGDYDADGFPDIYVSCYGPNCLYRNLGDGTFEEVAVEANVADERWGTSVAFLDADDDGLLDLYLCNYGEWTPGTNQYCGDRDRGIRMFCSPTSIEPQPDVLFRNQADGTFADASQESGIHVRQARGQGVVAGDVNDDGLIDLYVGNDLHPNSLFIGTGKGKFRDASEESGTAYDARGNSQAGMGVDIVDADGDGKFDLFVTNFQNENNCLYENNGEVFFREVSYPRGLAAKSIPWVGWGAAFSDFDADGWFDVVITNGHVDDNRHLLGQDAPYFQPALLFQNHRGTFRLIDTEAGDYFSVDHVGRGLVLADLDRDGDQDVTISHQDTAPGVLMNQIGDRARGRNWIVLRLIGTLSNRDAIGSRVVLQSSVRRVVTQIKGGGSYLSAPDTDLHFALLPEDSNLTFEIRWPDRSGETIRDLQANRRYCVIQNPNGSSLVVSLQEY